MSKAEQVIKCFVKGSDHYVDSPLVCLRTAPKGTMSYLVENIYNQTIYQKIIALNIEGIIIICSSAINPQITKLLRGQATHKLSDQDFDIVFRIVRVQLMTFSLFKQTIANWKPLEHREIKKVAIILNQNNIPNPYGETIDDLLRFANRKWFKGEYRAALTNWYLEDVTLDTAQLSAWTFFKDETDALMMRIKNADSVMVKL